MVILKSRKKLFLTIDCANLYSWESEIFVIWYFNFILTLIMTGRHQMVIGLCSRIFISTHVNSNQHKFHCYQGSPDPYLPAIFSVYPSVSHSNPYSPFLFILLLVSFESLLFPFNHLITNLKPIYYFLIN